jgi:hypothetical protein
VQKLTASDAATSDNFGSSVAFSSDGTTIVVGASGENTSPNSDNGAAYIFTKIDGIWTEQAKLIASDAASNDSFGYSAEISDNGNTVIIGAHLEDTNTNSNNGAAYIFTRSGTTWTEQQKLLPSDLETTGGAFGSDVSLSGDGNTALIGRPFADSAYVFTRSGTTWTEQQKLSGSGNFGRSVSLSSDGDTAVVSAPNQNNGVAYVLTRSGTTWTEQQILSASDGLSNDSFGQSVYLSANAGTLIVGASGEDTSPASNQGAIYIYDAVLNWSSSTSIGAYADQNYVRANNVSSPSNYVEGTLIVPTSGNRYIITNSAEGSFEIGSTTSVRLSIAASTTGATGSFTTATHTVTVINGLITDITAL